MFKVFAVLTALIAVPAAAQAQGAPVGAVYGADGAGFTFGVGNVVKVELGDNPKFNQILVYLDAATARKLAALTSANVGRVISIRLCGKEIFKPVVQTTIEVGGMALAGYTPERAREIADILSGRRACDGPSS